MKNLQALLVLLLMVAGCHPATPPEEPDVIQNGIRWAGEDETANYLANSGLSHYMNIELEAAYMLSQHAVRLDSSLFASHTLLAMLTTGDEKQMHKEMANKYVMNENETSKLFVSLLDVENDTTREQRRALWTKMHELSNGPFIHHMYIRFMDIEKDTAAVIAELDNLIGFAEENGMIAAASASYNIKGYLLQSAGDLAGGTAAIDKYMELYPGGYNPLDSRAEFYLFAGDTTSAIEMYKKVLEKFPYATSATEQLDELADGDEDDN
jgi:tetratricopeptide (TPR) repeat protein